MADTPLPERGESCKTFLLWCKNPAALRAGNPAHVKAQTFRRTSVQSERLCGAACPYLDQLSCGQLRVLCVCFGSSAPLPPRLLRHLYRDPGWATAQTRRSTRFLFRGVLLRAPYWAGHKPAKSQKTQSSPQNTGPCLLQPEVFTIPCCCFSFPK